MTLSEFKTILDSTGYEVAYEHFPESEAPSMPFICYAEAGSNNFGADGKVYEPIKAMEVQLFTKTKDTVAEGKVETALNNSRIFWQKVSEFEDDEICYRAIYEVQI